MKIAFISLLKSVGTIYTLSNLDEIFFQDTGYSVLK